VSCFDAQADCTKARICIGDWCPGQLNTGPVTICEKRLNMMEFRYLFRKPTFPLVGSVEGHFIGAKNPEDLSSQLVKIQFNKDGSYDLADFTGEGWSLYIAEMMISPLTIKKRWTKLEIIKLFNERENVEVGEGKKYSEKSLSAKCLDKIISDLVELSSGSGTK
jgi:hypothetical protein